MPQLIKGRAVTDDRWTLLRDARTLADVPEGVPAIVPLPLWRAERAALVDRGDVGVWLAPSDDPAELASDLAQLPLIAVDFPQFTDGRGYSTARLLRDKHGYQGELRAIGDVLRDQLFALAQCGFDAFAIRADRDAAEALAGLEDFAGVYATTSVTPQPWFRRRAPAAVAGADPAALDRRVAEALQVLRRVAARHAPAVFASSFGAEDMVAIDLIATHKLPIRIFTLDTGRLPEETHALIDRVRKHYGVPVDVYTPDAGLLQAFVGENGVNAFYDSVEMRKGCCAVRKTEPLQRALVAKGAWITGLRRSQSVTREAIAVEEHDDRARAAQIQSAGRMEPRRRLDLPPCARRSIQRAARSRLSVHRLRALHTRHRTRRGRPRGPLVVGAARAQGMRAASATGSGRGRRRSAAGHGGGIVTAAALDQRAPAPAVDGVPAADADHLSWLESEAIHILREVAGQCRNPALLFSGGKDSLVLLRLAEKAFRPARFPFPLLHIDTGHNFPEVITCRDHRAAELGEQLIVRLVEDSIASGRVVLKDSRESRNPHQSVTLLDAIAEFEFDACIGGARRDEEKARAKERIFSFRDAFGQWDPKNQRPELWSLYNARTHPGENVRVFPISNWTELDVWQYIARERLEVPSIYLAHTRPVVRRGTALVPVTELTPPRSGEVVEQVSVRFRTVGDITCTAPVASSAASLEAIIAETAATTITERGATRLDDQTNDASMELRKREGYF